MKLNNKDPVLLNEEEKVKMEKDKPFMNDVTKAINSIKERAKHLSSSNAIRTQRSKSRQQDDEGSVKEQKREEEFMKKMQQTPIATKTMKLLNMDTT